MPSYRKDPITDRWVIMSRSRQNRPNDYVASSAEVESSVCPFCEGSEQLTPQEIYAVRPSDTQRDTPQWQVRVLPNKFPAVSMQAQPMQTQSITQINGINHSAAGVGLHEVIVESPQHLTSITQLEVKQFATVLRTYRHRLLEIKSNHDLPYALIFKNVGEFGGASLRHIHSQLIAMPMIASLVKEELNGSEAFFQQQKRCIYCEMIQQELQTEQRIVIESEHFLAFCPFASRFAYETWIVPRRHCSHFEEIGSVSSNHEAKDGETQCDEIEDLAVVFHAILSKIESLQKIPAYNYIIHTAPFDRDRLSYYHWHIEIIPRTTQIAGFEWGTGSHINSVTPEEAAAVLR